MSKNLKTQDPFFEREAQNYENPAPSREFILSCLENCDKPQSVRQLMDLFGLNAQQRKGLGRRLKAMMRDGQLIKNRRGHYALVKQMELVRGSLQVHKEGFGFLITQDTQGDIFLPARQIRGLFTEDIVLVRVMQSKQRSRREGIVVEVLERNTHQVVGRLTMDDGIGWVTPESHLTNQSILVAAKHLAKAQHEEFVIVELLPQDSMSSLRGKVVGVLGNELTPGLEVELAIRSHDIPNQWLEAISQELGQFNDSIETTTYASRKDLTHLSFITIDGEDARDFDDAVFCEPWKEGGFRAYVAIADVSYYVKPGSAIDQEAQNRGNSVYFPSKAIPMLPEKLAHDLCSLKPEVKRLTFVCEMQIDQLGQLQHNQFYQAIIQSRARLTYDQVIAAKKDNTLLKTPLNRQIHQLFRLYRLLIRKRKQRGALDFDTIETKLLFDDRGKIRKIVPVIRHQAHRLIEELMLLTNYCAAQRIQQAQVPVLYRNHESPHLQKLESLRSFLRLFRLRLGGKDQPQSMDYARLIQRIAKRKDQHLLQTVLLRSLSQAQFEAKNKGHFGLAYDAYCQFTSPIRRYPDLLVHRCLKHLLHIDGYTHYPYDALFISQLGEHCSMTERRADCATRDASDWLKCDFMKDQIGQIFKGRISSVVAFGLFVELDDIYVEGLIHINTLDNDYYHYNDTLHCLEGKCSGKIYRLGDAIRVMLARVNLDKRRIDFEQVDEG